MNGMAKSRVAFVLLLALLCAAPAAFNQETNQPTVTQLLSQGDSDLVHQDLDKAMHSYEKADKLAQHPCALCFLRMADIKDRQGDLSKALDYAKKASLGSGSDNALKARSYLVQGVLLVKMAQKDTDKKLPEAADDFHSALALNPSLSIAHYNLGIAFLKMRWDEAGIAEMKIYVSLSDASPANVAQARRIIVNPNMGRETPAPDFTVPTLEGQMLSLSDLRGKIVLLDFWGTWCGPCRESVSTLQGIYGKYAASGFQIVGISSDKDEKAWKEFIQKNQMIWPEYLDISQRVEFLYEVHTFPTFVLLDGDGVVTWRQSGYGPSVRMDLSSHIEKLLHEELPSTATPASTTASPDVLRPSS